MDTITQLQAEPAQSHPAATVGPVCFERRPGHDPLTGNPQPGATETSEYDRLPCTATAAHTGDHRDAAGRTWPNTTSDTQRRALLAEIADNQFSNAMSAVEWYFTLAAQAARAAGKDPVGELAADAVLFTTWVCRFAEQHSIPEPADDQA